MIFKQIAVIGSGTMGNGIAHIFTQKGFRVSLIDISPAALEKAMGTITQNLNRQIAKGTLTEKEKTSTLNNINIFSNLPEGVAQANLVIEAATENADLKLKIFSDLDAFTSPETILA